MKKLISILLVLALVLCGCTQAVKPQDMTTPPESTVQSTESPQTETPGDSAGFTAHYIDVGHADSILLECGGKFMLIDGGNNADSSKVVSYLLKQGVKELEAVVGTHGHEDHIGGLAGVLAKFPTKHVYCGTTAYKSKAFSNFVKYAEQRGHSLEVPKPGLTFPLGDATVTVLGPVKTYESANNVSIVLMVQYGENRFLFTGDMEREAEIDLLDSGADVKADVLKVGHHGSYTSTSYRFLREVNPKYAVISCGKANTYGHPHEEVTSRLKDAGVPAYRCDELGNIRIHSDGKELSVEWEKKNAYPGISNTEEYQHYFIGDSRKKEFHTRECSLVPDSQFRREAFDTYEEAIEAGYEPCPHCNPKSK